MFQKAEIRRGRLTNMLSRRIKFLNFRIVRPLFPKKSVELLPRNNLDLEGVLSAIIISRFT
jgi:hypothetical protein